MNEKATATSKRYNSKEQDLSNKRAIIHTATKRKKLHTKTAIYYKDL